MSKEKSSPNKPSFLKEWGGVIVLFSCIAILRLCFLNHYMVPSGSMEPVLQPKDRVLVDMRAYGLRVPFTNHTIVETGKPKQGDVVLFFSPDKKVRLIKRIVATEGQKFEVRNGLLIIDDKSLQVSEDQEKIGETLVTLNLESGPGPDFGPTIVPKGKLLMIGDHRGNSLDGRMFGFIDEETVYGKAQGIFWRNGFVWRKL